MELKTNEEHLVMLSVQCEIGAPKMIFPYDVSHNGKVSTRMGMGGICYNIKVGSPALGWIGEHIEPGISAVFKQAERKREEWLGLHIPTCIGNEARVVSGDGKGAKGIITGLHTAVLIDFASEDMEKLAIGDKILIKSYGLGLELIEFPRLKCMNLVPSLLGKVIDRLTRGSKPNIKIRAEIPPELMGSGLGITSPLYVDYDIMTSDKKVLESLGITNMRIGDIVAIYDHFALYGPCYKKGAITIGVVIHGDSVIAGHGPGVLPIFTSEDKEEVELEVSPDANIGCYLKCGIYRKT